MSKVKYQIKVTEVDPFDIMCGECVEHEVTYYQDITLEELREQHQAEMLADGWMTPDDIEIFKQVNGYDYPMTNPDFEAWLQKYIDVGYVLCQEVAA
ncbi:MAG: hypothetical protein NC548_47425 [Lachnospiraceae bacterium]|nr:hypothetical protein [Lachnospiraceae bacterium]